MSLITQPKTQIPHSTATNAYDLISDACQAMLDEPRRLDMDFWILRGLHKVAQHRPVKKTRPACNTVACAAGWIVTCAGRIPREAMDSRFSIDERSDTEDTEDMALRLLGAHWRATGEDRYEMRGQFREFFGDNRSYGGQPGTKAYAQEVVERLKRLQKRWARELKATAVEPITIAPAEPVLAESAP